MVEARDVPAGPAAARYAGLVTRSMGLGVDIGVLTLACLIIGALPVTAAEAILGTAPSWLKPASALCAAQVPWLYFTLCWWVTGQTVGGVIMGEWVRRTDGRRLPLWRAAVRAIGGLLLTPVWLVGMLGTLADGRRRAWHDRVFGTVVRRDRPPDRAPSPG